MTKNTENTTNDDQRIRSVVIVGGGSAGWITAGLIAAKHGIKHGNKSGPGLKVTLIESPDVPIIGVGEGTWPTMRSTLLKMGISETDFIRECDVSFKQGAKFAKWVTGDDDDFYYHPLMLPHGFSNVDLSAYWHEHQDRISFSNAVCLQEALCEQGLAPKLITTPEFDSIANYAYHLNAGKFSQMIRIHCIEKLGVVHILDNVTGVKALPNGDIAAVETTKTGDLHGDLFVDCTGFSSLLLDKHYQIPFVDCSDVLFIDNALAVQVGYESEEDPIASHTISTGQRAGWIWDIGLKSRRGVGHVYSSRHTTKSEAEADLLAYIGKTDKDLTLRHIPIRSGHRKKFWQNNCVAVGLAAGFLEPLEASALVLVELSASMIADQMPATRPLVDIVAKRFNESFSYRWDRIIDFLKLHYILSKRTDNQFWIDNRDPDTIPDSLKELMALWKYRPPGDVDFSSNNEVFPAASYQYVLYGMGFRTQVDSSPDLLAMKDKASELFQQNAIATQKAVAHLPTNRALLDKIHAHGFQNL